jgi:hypothetical protein
VAPPLVSELDKHGAQIGRLKPFGKYRHCRLRTAPVLAENLTRGWKVASTSDRSLSIALNIRFIRCIFGGTNDRLHDPSQTVRVSDADGKEKDVPRIERLKYLLRSWCW